MIRRPPRSTLFPTRRSSDLSTLLLLLLHLRLRRRAFLLCHLQKALTLAGVHALALILGGLAGRSEEHTSELQSQFHLVCRLLLEKKKTAYYTPLQISNCILY